MQDNFEGTWGISVTVQDRITQKEDKNTGAKTKKTPLVLVPFLLLIGPSSWRKSYKLPLPKLVEQ